MFVIMCTATSTILGPDGRLGFSVAKSHKFIKESDGQVALRKYLKANPSATAFNWVVVPTTYIFEA